MSYIGNTQQNQSFVPAVDFFSGDGSTTAFTLSKPVASTAQIQAVISNVPQTPGVAYTVSGSTITFTSAPPSGTNNIYVYYTSPNTQVIAPSDASVQTSSIANSAVTTAKIADGQITPTKLSTGYPYWDASGNVGIGTSSPGSILNVYNATSASVLVQGDSATNIIINRASTDATGPVYVLRKSRGTTASPTTIASGDVVGSVSYQGYGGTNNRTLTAIQSYVDTYTSDTNISSFMTFGTSASGAATPTERMRIDSSGNLLVGTSTSRGTATFAQSIYPLTNNAYNLGSATYRWSVIYLANNPDVSSDIRLKTDVQDSDLGLEFVSALRPVKYKFKVGQYLSRKDENGNDLYDESGEPLLDEREGVRYHYGFIAQQVKEALGDKDAAFWKLSDKDNPESQQALSYEQIISPLVKAIQELKAELDDAKNRIAVLEAK